MDEFEQSALEKETNDYHNTCYQNAIHYKEKENAFIKKLLMWFIFFCLSYKTRGNMTEVFSVGLQTTDNVILKYIIPLKNSQLKPIQIL